eukprot:bmy_05936T0
MTSLYNRLYSKITLIAFTFDYLKHMIHSPCSRTTKTRRLWYIMNYNNTKPINRFHSILFSHTLLMRNNHNEFNLFTSNRLKVTYHILFCRSHSTCFRSHSYPNTLKLYRSHRSNNCPQPHIIHIILPHKFKLLTNSQPNDNSSQRSTNIPPINSNVMTTSKPNKPSSTPNY